MQPPTPYIQHLISKPKTSNLVRNFVQLLIGLGIDDLWRAAAYNDVSHMQVLLLLLLLLLLMIDWVC